MPEEPEPYQDKEDDKPAFFAQPLPSEIAKGILRDMAQRRKEEVFRDKVEAFARDNSETHEREVAMGLWADMGDLTPTYWSGMRAIRTFVNCSERIKKMMHKHEPAVTVRLLEALSASCLHSATLMRGLSEMKDQHERDSNSD